VAADVADTHSVTASSPRLDSRLRAAAAALDDADHPVAETWRKVGELAVGLGLPRPGYDTIRLVVRSERRRRAERREALEPVLADLVQGRLSPWDVDRLVQVLGSTTERGPSR
jgi:hypothetical protein